MLRRAVNRVQEEPIRAGVGDLPGSGAAHAHDVRTGRRYLESTGRVGEEACVRSAARGRGQDLARGPGLGHDHEQRSEEHTSELQSRRDLVCRLLLEKKKKKNKKR